MQSSTPKADTPPMSDYEILPVTELISFLESKKRSNRSPTVLDVFCKRKGVYFLSLERDCTHIEVMSISHGTSSNALCDG
jgi:hypothetical protein